MASKKKVAESAGKATVKKVSTLFNADEETDSDSDTLAVPVATKSSKGKEDIKLKEKEKQKELEKQKQKQKELEKEKEKQKQKEKEKAKSKPVITDSSDESSSDEEQVVVKKKVEDNEEDEEEETHNETSDGEEKEAPNGDEFLINLFGQETFEKTLSTLEAVATAASQLRTVLGTRIDEILAKRSRSSSSSDDPDAPPKKAPRVKGATGTKAAKRPKEDENARIFLAGRRIPYDELKAKYGGEILLVDVSDRGSFKRFHMCFPHGKIPIPNTKKDLFSQTVQGIYEGSKIFEKQGKNLYSMRESDPPKILRPETEATGPLKGYLTSLHGEELMDEKTARYKLLIEPYKWLLENTLKDEVTELKKQLNDPEAKIVIVDRKPPSIYWDDPNEPVSHGLLLREYLNDRWPSLDDDFSAFHSKKKVKKASKAKASTPLP